MRVVDPLPPVVDPQSPPLTPRQAAYLILLKPENQEQQEAELLGQLMKQRSDLAAVVELAGEFLRLLREQQAEGFDAWLMKAMSSPFKAFQTFAEGLIEDYAAVEASMTTKISNGPVEGLNNRLKILKRYIFTVDFIGSSVLRRRLDTFTDCGALLVFFTQGTINRDQP